MSEIDVWIITNGYENGLTQLITRAIDCVKLKNEKRKITAIAVCQWEYLRNSEELIKTKEVEFTII